MKYKSRIIESRIARLIDRVSARSERQTMKPHADVVSCTSIIGAIDTQLGYLERKLREGKTPAMVFASFLRVCKRHLETHECIRKMRARMATVQAAIKRSKQGCN